jgi:hypothetical protein
MISTPLSVHQSSVGLSKSRTRDGFRVYLGNHIPHLWLRCPAFDLWQFHFHLVLSPLIASQPLHLPPRPRRRHLEPDTCLHLLVTRHQLIGQRVYHSNRRHQSFQGGQLRLHGTPEQLRGPVNCQTFMRGFVIAVCVLPALVAGRLFREDAYLEDAAVIDDTPGVLENLEYV